MVSRSLVSPLAIALVVAGLLLAAFGAVYLTVAASHLPSFVPGHIVVPTHALRNGRTIHTHPDTKRGILVIAVAAVVFSGAWFLKFRYDPVD